MHSTLSPHRRLAVRYANSHAINHWQWLAPSSLPLPSTTTASYSPPAASVCLALALYCTMSIPPPETVNPHALDSSHVTDLYNKLLIAQLEFDGCDELIKKKRLGAAQRKVSVGILVFAHITDKVRSQREKSRYRSVLLKAKKAITDLGLDRKWAVMIISRGTHCTSRTALYDSKPPPSSSSRDCR